jgi:hypothetical protein
LKALKNPVTGEEQETKIPLPKGFIFKLADAAKSKVIGISTPNMNVDDSGQNASFAQAEYRGPCLQTVTHPGLLIMILLSQIRNLYGI